jgi:hypothetical protein
MDNVNAFSNRPVSYSFTQGIGEYSSEQLNRMDIADLMTVVMTRMLDAKEVQFKQKLAEADARTKKLEGYGEELKALARLKAEYGADDKDDTTLRDAKGIKDEVSSDQWDESAADNLLAKQSADTTSTTSGVESSSKYKAYEDLGYSVEVWSDVKKSLKSSLTDSELTYLYDGGTGNSALDKSIQNKYVDAWNAAGYEPPKSLSETDKQQMVTHGGSTTTDQKTEDTLTTNAAVAYDNYQKKLATSTDATTSAASGSDSSATATSTWRSGLSDEGAQIMANVDTFCEQGLANGTLTDADVANIKSGDFKKSEFEALEVAIKNEQDKISSLNTRDQIDIQKITNQIDQLNSLISTLTKKFNEGATGVVNRM